MRNPEASASFAVRALSLGVWLTYHSRIRVVKLPDDLLSCISGGTTTIQAALVEVMAYARRSACGTADADDTADGRDGASDGEKEEGRD